MTLKNNVRLLVVQAGFKSLFEFAKDKGLSYYLLRKLANNETNSIDITFMIELCKALKCGVSDLIYLEEEESLKQLKAW